MGEAGLEQRQSSIDSENETEVGYLGTKSLLVRNERVTAIFAGNDPTAQGVLQSLARLSDTGAGRYQRRRLR